MSLWALVYPRGQHARLDGPANVMKGDAVRLFPTVGDRNLLAGRPERLLR